MVTLAQRALDYNENQDDEAAQKTTVEQALRVPEQLAGLRLDQAVARMFPNYSRNRLQHWIRVGQITVDEVNVTPKQKVWGGEWVKLRPELVGAGAQVAQPIPLSIVYENTQILVIDKPAGLVVHPGSGNPDGTLLNALLHYSPVLAAVPRAGIVHRLDKDTSGLLVVAKTVESQTHLVRQLQKRTMRREYAAVVTGNPPSQGIVETAIGRHPVARTRMAVAARGKPARTHYRVLRRGRGWSLLECRLDTGRTHQIRVHMHSIGHPLVGDPVYGARKSTRGLPEPARHFHRQALHAMRLLLVDPGSGTALAFESPLPADFVSLLAQLEQHAVTG
jgi:23S rRNA pseudouridine1911/1915/1917 synthase